MTTKPLIPLLTLQAHVHYAGGYHEDHPIIQNLWEVVEEMTPSEQEDFLRFVTSCSRPPLLGFKYLEPQLCIQVPLTPQDCPLTSPPSDRYLLGQ